MFDGNERLVVCNRRYMEMYSLSADIVKPGCSLQSVLEYRLRNGSFSRDPIAYRRELLGTISAGKTTASEVKSKDGRAISVINRPMPDGGWVATHEDITERRDAERERVSMQEQQQRRAVIDQAIAAFRRQVEDHLKTVAEGAKAMRSTATTLFSNSGQTSNSADGAVTASNEASTNVETAAVAADELSGSINEIGRQLAKTTEIVRSAVGEAQGTNHQITALAQAAQKIGDVIKLIRAIAGQTNLLALNATIEAARAGEAGNRRGRLRGQVAGGTDRQGDRGYFQADHGRTGGNFERGVRHQPHLWSYAGNRQLCDRRFRRGRGAECRNRRNFTECRQRLRWREGGGVGARGSNRCRRANPAISGKRPHGVAGRGSGRRRTAPGS